MFRGTMGSKLGSFLQNAYRSAKKVVKSRPVKNIAKNISRQAENVATDMAKALLGYAVGGGTKLNSTRNVLNATKAVSALPSVSGTSEDVSKQANYARHGMQAQSHTITPGGRYMPDQQKRSVERQSDAGKRIAANRTVGVDPVRQISNATANTRRSINKATMLVGP